jgi:hypothetical protein
MFSYIVKFIPASKVKNLLYCQINVLSIYSENAESFRTSQEQDQALVSLGSKATDVGYPGHNQRWPDSR